MPKTGYHGNAASSRQRFDARFEVQRRPWIYRCELTPQDWNLEDFEREKADKLNDEFVTAINSGLDRNITEQKMARTIIELNIVDKAGVFSTVERLLRATFD